MPSFYSVHLIEEKPGIWPAFEVNIPRRYEQTGESRTEQPRDASPGINIEEGAFSFE